MTTHVLFEGAPGVIVRDAGVVIEGVEFDALLDAAQRAGEAATRIELCGGLPVDAAARVRREIGAGIEVRLNRYAFESLEQIAAYKAAFGAGEDPGDALFLYAAAASTPLVAHPGVLVAGVADEADLVARVREAHARGVGIIELYAGLGIEAAAAAREAVADALPVGFVE